MVLTTAFDFDVFCADDMVCITAIKTRIRIGLMMLGGRVTFWVLLSAITAKINTVVGKSSNNDQGISPEQD